MKADDKFPLTFNGNLSAVTPIIVVVFTRELLVFLVVHKTPPITYKVRRIGDLFHGGVLSEHHSCRFRNRINFQRRTMQRKLRAKFGMANGKK